MASLNWYQKKFGKREGRRKYNAFHREYREKHAPELSLYWKNRRAQKRGKVMHMAHTAL